MRLALSFATLLVRREFELEVVQFAPSLFPLLEPIKVFLGLEPGHGAGPPPPRGRRRRPCPRRPSSAFRLHDRPPVVGRRRRRRRARLTPLLRLEFEEPLVDPPERSGPGRGAVVAHPRLEAHGAREAGRGIDGFGAGRRGGERAANRLGVFEAHEAAGDVRGAVEDHQDASATTPKVP